MSDEPGAHVYMLKCADRSYYVGSARLGLDRRISEHNNGTYAGYTSKRSPLPLVWAEHFRDITDAIAVERQIKRWRRGVARPVPLPILRDGRSAASSG